MKTSLRVFPGSLSLVFLFLLLIGTSPGFSQDDPNKDQLPKELRKLLPKADPQAVNVITVNDFDNYHIGTDYAETHISGNPQNPLQYYGAWNSGGNAGGAGYRTDNAYDWVASNPAWGNNGAGDIVLAYDSLGNLYYENMYFSGANIGGCKVAVSSDNGVTWSVPVNAIAGSDKNWIAADQTAGPYSNYVYTTMTGSTNQGKFARSTDFGATWTNTWTFNTQSLPGMMVCVGPEGNVQGGAVYVVTHSGQSTSATYTFYKSTDGGLTFQLMSAQNFPGYVGSFVNNRHSVQNMRTRPYPFIAADNSFGPYRGRLYIVYTSNNPAGNLNKPDIFCHYSDDGGATFSNRITVNDDVNSQNNHNFFPAIWCDKETGRLYVQWMDSRDTPTADSALIYSTYSDDGGQSFAVNQAVSNQKMPINCTQCPGSGTPKYQGDYNGVVFHRYGSVQSWTDFRNGTFANFIGFFPDFAMRADPPVDTLIGIASYQVSVPSVKLFTDTVYVEASIDNGAGLFAITFPSGNKIWGFPGSVPVEISGIGTVPSGTYTVRFTAKGINGTPVHKRSALLKVFNFVMPQANFQASTDSACLGQPIVFTDLSGGPATNRTWYFSGGMPAISHDVNPVVVFNSTGAHDVKLVVSNPVGSDSLTKTGYIMVDSIVAAPTVTSLDICINSQPALLTAVGQNIRWYSNAGLTTLVGTGNTFNASSYPAGNYTLYATQTQGVCESPASAASLSLRALPLFNLGIDREVCANNTLSLVSTGAAVSWQWNIGNFTTSSIQVDTAIAGMGLNQIICTATNAAGCMYTDTITLNFVECIGFEEVFAGVSAMIYPNPVIDHLQIILTSKNQQQLNVAVQNATGQMILPEQRVDFSGETLLDIDLKSVESGIYFLRFQTSQSSVTKRIVVNH